MLPASAPCGTEPTRRYCESAASGHAPITPQRPWERSTHIPALRHTHALSAQHRRPLVTRRHQKPNRPPGPPTVPVSKRHAALLLAIESASPSTVTASAPDSTSAPSPAPASAPASSGLAPQPNKQTRVSWTRCHRRRTPSTPMQQASGHRLLHLTTCRQKRRSQKEETKGRRSWTRSWRTSSKPMSSGHQCSSPPKRKSRHRFRQRRAGRSPSG